MFRLYKCLHQVLKESKEIIYCVHMECRRLRSLFVTNGSIKSSLVSQQLQPSAIIFITGMAAYIVAVDHIGLKC